MLTRQDKAARAQCRHVLGSLLYSACQHVRKKKNTILARKPENPFLNSVWAPVQSYVRDWEHSVNTIS